MSRQWWQVVRVFGDSPVSGRLPVGGPAGSRSRRRERRALAGACAALAALATALAAAGFLGGEIASQTLLANLRVHVAVAGALLWIGAWFAGWTRLAVLGALAALALAAATVAEARWTPLRAAPPEAVRFRLLAFNMLYTNTAGAEIAAWLIREGPDLVVAVESLPLVPHLGALAAAYPHRVGCEAAECDVMILSRAPLTDGAVRRVADSRARIVSARAAIGPVGVWIHGVHWEKGFFGGAAEQKWATDWEIRRRRREDGAPFVVAGDFNAAPWDPALTGLARRRDMRLPLAWLPTWPTALGPFGFQIDHVAVSPEIGVEALRHSPDDFGSNHRGVIAALALSSGR